MFFKSCYWCGVRGKDLYTRVLEGIGAVKLCSKCKASHDAAAR